MMFRRRERFVYVETPRRRSNAARALLREQDKLPLFAGEIASEQERAGGVAGRLSRIRDSIQASERSMRELEARHWREGRIRYFRQSPTDRSLIAYYWRVSGYPKTGTYFAGMMRRIEEGRLYPAEELLIIERAAEIGRHWRATLPCNPEIEQ